LTEEVHRNPQNGKFWLIADLHRRLNMQGHQGLFMKTLQGRLVVPLLSTALGIAMCSAFAGESITDSKLVVRGRYIAQVSGCNDCHTEGYLVNNGKVPVDQWLSGSSFGWRGPWGTTYGSNLRLFMKDLSEAQWIKVAHTLKRRPPMPWFNLNAMDDDDLRALYQFVHSLGDPGAPSPAYLPPGEEPRTAYASFPAPPPTK
jgi:mono/diheme cytochrome c family protein